MVILASAFVTTTEATAESPLGGLAALGVNGPVLLAQIVNFLLLLILLRLVLYRPVLKLLADRRRLISEGIRAAEAQKKALADFEIERDRLLAKARDEAHLLLTKTRQEIKAEQEAFRTQLKAERERIVNRARREAEALRARALASARGEIAELVVAATQKIIQEPAIQVALTKTAAERVLKELS